MIDNFYPETVEESGAFLRQALKEIASYNLAYTPIAYAVWYEYVTGRNPELIREMDQARKTANAISDDMVLEWFKKHIATRQLLAAEQKTRELKAIISEITAQIGSSGSRLSDHGEKLAAYTRRLETTSSVEEIMDISRGIMSGTHAVVSDSQSLKKEMDETLTEIHALKKELEGLKQEAKTDMLTGLLNRRGFKEAMDKAMDQTNSSSTPLSVIIADIDHFKRINDSHGHLIGDSVLKMLARFFREHIKGKDIVARFGGEEFIMVLPETPLKGAFVLAEQIRLNLKTMRWRTKSGSPIGAITMSLGVAQHRAGESIPDLIERADTALYQAKSTGRNKTQIEAPD